METSLRIKRAQAAVVVMALALACGFGLIQANTASAQLPAICEQYPDLDICIGPTDNAQDDGDFGPGAGNGGNGDSNGTLPFTGYPMNALMLLLVALLAAGLGTRGYVAVRERAQRNSSAS